MAGHDESNRGLFSHGYAGGYGYQHQGYQQTQYGYPQPGGYSSHGVYPPTGYPSGYGSSHGGGHMGPMLAGGAAVAATAYGAHKLSHGHGYGGHGGHQYGHGYGGHHGKFKHGHGHNYGHGYGGHGKFKHGHGHGYGGHHGKFNKWK
ncbi:hypothetical protein EJB05_34211, partial [Eragrostis curvula]